MVTVLSSRDSYQGIALAMPARAWDVNGFSRWGLAHGSTQPLKRNARCMPHVACLKACPDTNRFASALRVHFL